MKKSIIVAIVLGVISGAVLLGLDFKTFQGNILVFGETMYPQNINKITVYDAAQKEPSIYIMPRGKAHRIAKGEDNEYMVRTFRLDKNLLKIYSQDTQRTVTIVVLNINHVRRAKMTDFEIELHF